MSKKRPTDIEELKKMDDVHDSDMYTGTTLIGVCAENATVVATDKQVTGNHTTSKVEKMGKVHPNALIAGSGLAAHCQKIIRDVRMKSKSYEIRRGRKISIESLANNLVQDISSSGVFPEYLCKPILGGYEDGESVLLEIGMLGFKNQKSDYATLGSGSTFATGYLESNFENNLSKDEAENLVADTLKCVSENGPYTGKGVDIGIIDEEHIEIKRDYIEL